MSGKTTRLGSHGDLKKMKNITSPRKKAIRQYVPECGQDLPKLAATKICNALQ